MTTAKDIGKKFKEERDKQGLSIAQAAQESNIHQKVLKDIENGIFDRMGDLYIKSFMKKYSLFLKMNTSEIMKLYEDISLEMPKKEFNPGNRSKKEASEDPVEFNPMKIQVIFIGILSIVLVVLVLTFLGMIRSRISTKTSSTTASLQQTRKVEEKPAPVEKTGFFNRKKSGNDYSLKIKATSDVWLQIKKNEDIIYAGIIKKGESRSWNFTSPVNVWTGKAENMEYIIDGKDLGPISKGVIKNIQVSGQGVKIDDVWAARTDR